MLSIDTKKKELISNFFREGNCYTTEPIKVYDHDFPSYADGKIIKDDYLGNWNYRAVPQTE